MEPHLISAVLVMKEAYKYSEDIPDHLKQKLEYFLHDWFRLLIDEEQARLAGEELSSQMFERFMKPFKEN